MQLQQTQIFSVFTQTFTFHVTVRHCMIWPESSLTDIDSKSIDFGSLTTVDTKLYWNLILCLCFAYFRVTIGLLTNLACINLFQNSSCGFKGGFLMFNIWNLFLSQKLICLGVEIRDLKSNFPRPLFRFFMQIICIWYTHGSSGLYLLQTTNLIFCSNNQQIR